MAGMEQLEIHSKSYIVRWVRVEDGHTISWSIQPHKKSINFGIVKHPRTDRTASITLAQPLHTPDEPLKSIQPDTESEAGKRRRASSSKHDTGDAQYQLKAKGFIPIQWYGKCEADKVAMGTYAVAAGQRGMYGMVFDNTFSKTISKTATLVLLTYPTSAPPNSALHNLAPAMGGALSIGGKGQSPRLTSISASESVDSLQSHLAGGSGSRDNNSSVGHGDETAIPSTYLVGVLLKRRRKKGQGYAKRYFSLDFVSCTLSYYHDRNSSALRGAIPLGLAAIAADERRKEISIDSGAEVWHLKAANVKEFKEWTKALEQVSNTARGLGPREEMASPGGLHVKTNSFHHRFSHTVSEEDREWDQVESLVSRIAGTRDAVRRLVKDTRETRDQRIAANRQSWLGLGLGSGSPTIPEDASGDYFDQTEKKPFWKRKSSTSSSQMLGRSLSSSQKTPPVVPIPATVTTVTANGAMSRKPKPILQDEESMHDHCTALLKDLDTVIADFTTLMSNSRRRRLEAKSSPRLSMDSTSTAEFYDAEDRVEATSQLLVVTHPSDDETPYSDKDEEFVSDDATTISSDNDDYLQSPHAKSFFPPKPRSFSPLPIKERPARRETMKPASVPPPNVLSFFRKNVGKDLSTISMPVSANEPTSLLMRLAENLEYANLLDAAAKHADPSHRLLLVSAFAISTFSNCRTRERALRKPFNPMLGETFELVRGDAETPGNFRFIAEKVSHRPVILACQADSPSWTFTHSPAPTQKFWGKSAELITDGRVHVVLRLPDGSDECYSWNIATVFLRNVVMGEKYVEPVGSMTIVNETSGAVATVEFKSKGMFGGRSEDVSADVLDTSGSKTGLGLTGTWTTSLRITDAAHGPGAEVWRVGKLVLGAESRYGFTEFAATLNEITPVDEKAAPTDSRFREDQRALEDGDLDRAEEMKAKLENAQRVRRKEMESHGQDWKPRWFVKMDGSEQSSNEHGQEDGKEKAVDTIWRLKGGKEGYWDERVKGTWTGVEDVLLVGKRRQT